MQKRGVVITISLLTLMLASVIVLQTEKINSLKTQLAASEQEMAMKEEQLTNDHKIVIKDKENEISTNKSNFETEKGKLNAEIERLNGLLRTNETTLFGERPPIIDPSIPTALLSPIYAMFEAMQADDVEKFRATHYSKLDQEANSLTSIFESRNNIEKILWIRNDPDKRADDIKEEYGLFSEVRLLKVYFLNTDHSIGDPNFTLVKENSAWKVFKWD
ncbi:hypothetical protein AB6A23_24560 [Paenibacillus tarimensis]